MENLTNMSLKKLDFTSIVLFVSGIALLLFTSFS
jgi:hypothetical protein